VLYWIYDIPRWLATALFIGVFLSVWLIRLHIRPLVADLSDENNLMARK
jgi:hypothetical protein